MADTIIAQSTPPGQSALAIVRVSGPLCESIAKEALTLPHPTPRFCYLRSYYSSGSQMVIDQVLAVLYQKNKSFTGEPTLEIMCHGNTFIVQKIVEDLLQRGCRIAQPGEFTKRAFLSGRIDLTQAESIAELISAKSDAELKIANLNLAGNQGVVFKSLQERILSLQAQLEASIDFPEEDIETESKQKILITINSIIEETKYLISNAAKKKVLTNAIKVLIIGPANVGKSTLFNTLLGQDRALVSETPGTTRDYISTLIPIGDYRIELIDCAGIRKTDNSTENLGIEKTIELIDEAYLILLVIDGSMPYPTDFDQKVLNKLKAKELLIIENKSDKQKVVLSEHYPEHLQKIEICARLKQDVDKIENFINRHLKKEFDHDPSDVTLINAIHLYLLIDSLSSLELAKKSFEENHGEEIVLQELSSSREPIDKIIGVKTNEDILDRLFGEFCIGK